MNCDCIDKLSGNLTEYFKAQGIDVIGLKIPTLIQMPQKNGDKMTEITFTDVTIKTPKKNQIRAINHNYCPFCGTNIEKEVSDEP